MAATLRLTKEEQKKAELKCREINKILIKNEMSPLKESELLHLVISIGLDRLKIDKKGKTSIE